MKTIKQKVILLLVGVFLASSFAGYFTAGTASADGASGSYISTKVSGQVLDHQLLYFLKRCFIVKDMDKVTQDEVTSWKWLYGSGSTNATVNDAGTPGDQSGARGGMYDHDIVGCDEGGYIREAFGRFGFTNALDTFCSLGFTYSRVTGGNGKEEGGGHNTAACKNGEGEGDFDGSGSHQKQEDDLDKLLATSEKYNDAKAPLSPAAEYVRYYRTFMKWCDIGLVEPYEEGAASGEGNLYKVAVVNQDGSVEYWLGQGGDATRTDASQAPLVANNTAGQPPFDRVSCGELAVALRSTTDGGKGYADAYAAYMQGPGKEDEGDEEEDDDKVETSCAVDGVGWIVCPVMNFLGKMNDAAFGFLDNFLAINSRIIDSTATKNAWSAFRDIANVAFVIAFMVIVYSQITSAGVSNYGIKKLLPRIVAAAILVNVSFYICAIAVDVSNIVGASAYSLLKDSINVGSEITTTQWEDTMGTILKGAAIGVGVIALVVALFMAPTVLLAFALIILILVARQALVILLIVIAPLAFVAYLLPNTEDWFKKWWKALTVTLMVFPIVSVVFGASTLASRVLMQVGQSGEEDEQMLQLIAMAVLAVPLFAVPAILKGSLSAAGSIGTRIAGLADRSTKMANNQFSNRAKQMGGGLRDAATERALNGTGFLGGRAGALIRSRARRNAKYDALSQRAKAAQEGFNATDERASEFQRAALKAEQTASLQKGINKDAAEIEHMDANAELHVRAKVADMDLEGVKSAQSAMMKELESVEGAAANPQISAELASGVRRAQEAIEIQGKRTNSAARVAQDELAKKINDDTTGMAVAAAGIGGAAAVTRVQAEATQIEHKAFDDAVSAEKTTMTSMTHDQLLAEMKNDTLSTERRAAAAGTIMARDYREGHLQALEAAGEIGRAGNDDAIGDIQKVMAYDMKDKPFALGDQAAGQLKIGTYGKPQAVVTNADGTTYQPPQLGDLNNEIVQRVEAKLSPASLAKLNPDELKRIVKLANSGSIQGEGLANLQSAIVEARKDDTLKGLIKPEASDAFDKLLKITPKSAQDAAASSYGPGI